MELFEGRIISAPFLNEEAGVKKFERRAGRVDGGYGE
jgi:hypothetical protein